LTRAGALDRIDVLLSTITDPAFAAVVRAEPLALAGTPVLAFWVQSRTPGWQTLTDIGSTTTIMVRAYFRMQPSTDVRETIEAQVWDAMVEIETKLRSDANLDGNVTDSTVGAAQVQYLTIDASVYRVVTVPFDIQIYEEITITP
jgi:hypothetical protein|tara:strand:+ start:1525 stop:1959 length:435 start_codon:yes stop_codon:yes gene_type:complete